MQTLNSLLEAIHKKPKTKITYLVVVYRLLFLLALTIFLIGLIITKNEVVINNLTKNKATKLTFQANNNINHIAPSTNKQPASTYTSYTVAPDLPKYILIPKISVNAIVRAVGLTSSGQLGTPDNVYDTAWYNQSSEPGQPGVSIIDGHVSSWTTNGVFYNLKYLTSGDLIQVVLGDGTIINYQVVKSKIYNSQNIDMTTVLAPVDNAKSGLNLITCGGDVIQGTNEFNERIVVFAEEI